MMKIAQLLECNLDELVRFEALAEDDDQTNKLEFDNL
jgi:hypothetical protein